MNQLWENKFFIIFYVYLYFPPIISILQTNLLHTYLQYTFQVQLFNFPF